MKRKLLRQITNEWRHNFWLLLELMIVSVGVWYIVTEIYTTYRIKFLPNGYITDNTFVMDVKMDPYSTETLNALDSLEQINARISQSEIIMNTIREMPGVEYLAKGINNMPYNYSKYGMLLTPVDADSISTEVNYRAATPEMPFVMKWQPLAGASSLAELSDVLERGEVVITRSVGRKLMGVKHHYDDGLEGAKALIGKKVKISGDRILTVGAVVEDMRRGYYEPANYGSLLYPLRRNTEDITDDDQILVRVDPSRRNEFLTEIKKAIASESLATSLYYISAIRSLDDISADHHSEQDTENRNKAIIALFLLASIFLGLLGTFWFRTSRRTSEIAVRMSTGASRIDIFRRLMGEGTLLLVLATIPAAIIDWALGWYLLKFPEEYESLFNPWDILFTCVGITFILLLAMTLAGIWLPARRAMAIDPAAALHAE